MKTSTLYNPSKYKYKIQVINKTTKKIILDIYRVLYSDMIGNFCPVFCRFNNDVYLVKSSLGDISDIFRRDETQKKFLYIEV